MYGRVMEIHADSPASHAIEYLAVGALYAIEFQADHIEMKSGAILRMYHRQLQRKTLQRRIICACKRISALHVLLESSELAQTQSRLNVRHPIIEAERMLLVVPC